ncbi:hypothetical protein HPB47_000636 [Ixodes persulcatus]|uniref:Uncharacterized protein n=1 Tax=Ixodes persulcatus TaxID=34615 RepID=A0AC60PRI1_IXOPE|nr:hypothetical protein HPB47_000636 [Ixodes persulcatus]
MPTGLGDLHRKANLPSLYATRCDVASVTVSRGKKYEDYFCSLARMRTVLRETLDAADCVASRRQQCIGETRLACAAVPKRSERDDGGRDLKKEIGTDGCRYEK